MTWTNVDLSPTRSCCTHWGHFHGIFKIPIYKMRLIICWKLRQHLQGKWIDPLMPRQNGSNFADNISLPILVYENCLFKFHWNLFLSVKSTISQIVTWHQSGIQRIQWWSNSSTHTCVTLPWWGSSRCCVTSQTKFSVYFLPCINQHFWIMSAQYQPFCSGYVELSIYCLSLTHWGWVTHICVGKLTIIGSDNGLSPAWRQVIIWTNAGILLIGPLGTNFSEILSKIQSFSFKKMHMKMLSGKWRPCCPGLNVLVYLQSASSSSQQTCLIPKAIPVCSIELYYLYICMYT